MTEIETHLSQLDFKTFGGELASYEGFPKEFHNTVDGCYVVLRDISLPVGAKLRITTEGIQEVVSNFIYKINNNDAVLITKSTILVDIEETITYIRIYNTTAQIKDYEKELKVKLECIGQKQDVEDIREDVADLQQSYKEFFGESLLDYEGVPVVGNYVNLTNIKLPVGTRIRIKVEEGWGTAISGYVYRINGVNPVNVKSNPDRELTLAEEATQFRINGTSNYVVDYTKNVKITAVVLGIKDDFDDLKEDVENLKKVSLVDFNTNIIVDNYATDKTAGTFATSFSFNVEGGKANENIIVSCKARFVNDTDSAVPTIQFTIADSNYTHYTSTVYTIGRKDEMVMKEWRIPALSDGQYLNVSVIVPSNVTLYIDEISNRYSDAVNRNALGYRMNAHVEIYGNFNNYDTFVLSAKLGYPCCICVPKRTTDGVWVCYHDDGAVGTSLVDENYNTLSADEQALSITDFAYNRLSQLWYKATRGVYRKVPTLEDFLMVCSKTGMHPMFSWHPVSSVQSMEEIKNMVKKYGLLPYLNIKMSFSGSSTSITYINRAYSVFGSEIESYIGDVNTDTEISTIIASLDTTNVAQNKDKVRVGIELYSTRLGSDTSKVQAILDAGYFAGCAWTTDCTADELEYWIRNGVTEHTEYKMLSYGLNW